MRVVYLNPCGQLGGAETSLIEILASLRAAAPDWELHLVLGEDGPLGAEARKRGVQVIVEPFPAALARLGDSGNHPLVAMGRLVGALGPIRRYQQRLVRVLATLRPDVIHTNGFKMHLLGAWARPNSARLVWHIHDYVSTRRFMSRLLRFFRGACSVAIVNSRSVASDVQAALPNLRVAPIYNAVDIERFSPSGSKLDLDALSGLQAPRGPVVRVGLVATFARWKGHEVFLRALAQLPRDVEIRGYIIGGPIYQTTESQWSPEELQREADRLGLRGRVGFTGFLRDVPPAMRSLDIAVHASTQPEPFGMVIIEAMACGKAVIASRAGGALELFIEGETALGHRAGDPVGLAEQMWRLTTDEGLRRRLGAAGRANVEANYHGKRLAQELLAVYGQVGDGSAAVRNTEMESCAAGN